MLEFRAVGIDLGTTYSAMAVISDHGATEMLRNQEGELLTPSVVLFETDETIVGRDAKRARVVAGQRVAEFAKRDIGRPAYHKPIGGVTIPPEAIEAWILYKLRSDIAAALGPYFKVVITVPAYFDEPRRKATGDAGEMAGLEVLDIVNEPTAAALAFGERLGYLSASGAASQSVRVLVYDLGGGTFDVTIIRLSPGEIVSLATDGDVHLGGCDWDERLVDFVADDLLARFGIDVRLDETALARIRATVEEAKHTLSQRDRAVVRFEHPGGVAEVPVCRAQFEEMTADLLERTTYTTRQVLATARLQWSEIDHVLLVGGSTRMPMVARRLQELSGMVPDVSVNPDEAVARGAALFAEYRLAGGGQRGRTAGFSVTDVNAHSLGVEGINQQTQRRENAILIPRNTPLPAHRRRKFVTKQPNQRSVVVQILEGESSIPSQCSPIGRAVIRNIPPGLPAGTEIEVLYRYQSNGCLSVRAKMTAAGNETGIDLERDDGLSAASVSRWRRIISGEGGFDEIVSRLGDGSPSQSSASGNPNASGQAAASATYQQRFAPADSASQATAASHWQTVVGQTGAAAGRPASLPRAQPQPDATAAQPVRRATAAATSPTAPPMPSPTGTATAAFRAPAAAAAPAQPQSSAALSGSRVSKVGWIISLLGHLIASTLGLAVGYYVLCYIAPHANFLELDLPGLHPTSQSNPGTQRSPESDSANEHP